MSFQLYNIWTDIFTLCFKYYIDINPIGVPCNGASSCCIPGIPCREGEGDCDVDLDCEQGLLCGHNNCPKKSGFSWDIADDCCYKPSNGKLNGYMNILMNIFVRKNLVRFLIEKWYCILFDCSKRKCNCFVRT